MVNGIGSKLKELRIGKGYTQKQVADALKISPSLLSNFESATRTPSVTTLIQLAKFYGCTADYLLGIEDFYEKVLDASMLTDMQHTHLQEFLDELKPEEKKQ